MTDFIPACPLILLYEKSADSVSTQKGDALIMKNRTIIKACPVFLLLLFGLIGIYSQGFADPQSGDLFREYKVWWDGGAGLRVGGKYDYGGGNKNFGGNVDLTNAIKAEVNIQKVLCHYSTYGLSCAINDNEWILVPEADSIPAPQKDYQHMIYPSVDVPLSQLKQGTNQIKFKVSKDAWWPQNLLYGAILRVYYDTSKKSAHTGKITSPKAGSPLQTSVEIAADVTGKNIKQVDYIMHGEDINWEGDGIYRQWHYHMFRQNISHHIGSATTSPYKVSWNTEWVPSQKTPIKLMARIIDNTDLVYMSPVVENLHLERPFSVELCKPFDIPRLWVTRLGSKSEKFNVTADKANIQEAMLAWCSWCPCYSRGIKINGVIVANKEGGCYLPYWHEIKFDNFDILRTGENTLSAEGSAGDQHGMEINYPGVMVLLKHNKDESSGVSTRQHMQNTDAASILSIDKARGKIAIAGNVHNHSLSIISADGSRSVALKRIAYHKYAFDTKRTAPGVYLIVVHSDGNDFVGRIILN